MKTIICSHGFGVRADSNGLFTAIADAFPDVRVVLFDYSEVRANGDTVIRTLPDQAESLQLAINQTQPDDEIALLCHSQGSIIAGMVSLDRVSKVILLAPPQYVSSKRVIAKMLARRGSVIRPNGVSMIPRTDGTKTYLPKEYLESVDECDPVALYKVVSETLPTTIVRAVADEMIGQTDFSTIYAARHIDIDSDHNFTKQYRQPLITLIKELT